MVIKALNTKRRRRKRGEREREQQIVEKQKQECPIAVGAGNRKLAFASRSPRPFSKFFQTQQIKCNYDNTNFLLKHFKSRVCRRGSDYNKRDCDESSAGFPTATGKVKLATHLKTFKKYVTQRTHTKKQVLNIIKLFDMCRAHSAPKSRCCTVLPSLRWPSLKKSPPHHQAEHPPAPSSAFNIERSDRKSILYSLSLSLFLSFNSDFIPTTTHGS